MNPLPRAFAFAVLALAVLPSGSAPAAESKPGAKPNVLFIAVDDMRDWTGYLGHGQAKTPNFDRLAKMGMTFTRAYTASALCNPSRTALLTGLRPGSTGVYGNGDDWRTAVPADIPSLPGFFHTHGYRTLGVGKIFHGGKLRREDWDEFEKDQEREEMDKDKKDWTLVPGKTPGAFTIGSNVILPVDTPEEELVDHRSASYAVAQLGRGHEKPFFLACGFHRPHLPWAAPRRFYDMFPLEEIQAPPTRAGDLDDLPPEGVKMAKAGEFAAIRDAGKWQETVRAYLASVAFTDAQLGRVLDALEKSPYKPDTIICLWSDHGWHLGEKEHWRKSTLWEEATRSPFLWVVPGLTQPGSVCDRPVDFLGVYPTLCELAGLPAPAHLQGISLKPLLADPKAPWDRPAVSTMKEGNHAVRTDRWRYIRYAGGGEELYDHEKDPNEWTNLAALPEHAAVKAELAKHLPAENKPAGEKAAGKMKPKVKVKKKKAEQAKD